MPKISELPTWFDRNPSVKADDYIDTGVAPHAGEKRLSYTCPKGRLAMVEILQVKVIRETAATAAKSAGATWYYKPSGGSNTYLLYVNLWTNNIGDKDKEALAATMIILEGDSIEGWTWDLAADGTMNYDLSYKLTEFDILPPIDRELLIEPAKPDIQQPIVEKPWWWPF